MDKRTDVSLPLDISEQPEGVSGEKVGYARVSTAKQDLDRQIDALRQEGIASKYIYVDKKSGSTTNRPGLHKALDQAREGDIIVVHTLDRSDAPQAVAACTPQ
ncbi:site-specific recombinase PinR [Mycobacteroides abscessus subsp. abscessus]|nr:site-specific recombinase PinR [Mycobacteroides abscessus subsp. abscessus]